MPNYIGAGCSDCSTVESFTGSLNGYANNNQAVNHLIAANQQANMIGNNFNKPNNNYNNNGYNNNGYNEVKLPQIAGSVNTQPTVTSQNNNGARNNKQVKQVPPVQTQNNKAGNDDQQKNKLYMLIKLVICILLALAIHETIKYHINHNIKFNEGSPSYFVYYCVGVAILLYVAHQYLPTYDSANTVEKYEIS